MNDIFKKYNLLLNNMSGKVEESFDSTETISEDAQEVGFSWQNNSSYNFPKVESIMLSNFTIPKAIKSEYLCEFKKITGYGHAHLEVEGKTFIKIEDNNIEIIENYYSTKISSKGITTYTNNKRAKGFVVFSEAYLNKEVDGNPAAWIVYSIFQGTNYPDEAQENYFTALYRHNDIYTTPLNTTKWEKVDPQTWHSYNSYSSGSVVKIADQYGTSVFYAKKNVPRDIPLNNTEYWGEPIEFQDEGVYFPGEVVWTKYNPYAQITGDNYAKAYNRCLYLSKNNERNVNANDGGISQTTSDYEFARYVENLTSFSGFDLSCGGVGDSSDSTVYFSNICAYSNGYTINGTAVNDKTLVPAQSSELNIMYDCFITNQLITPTVSIAYTAIQHNIPGGNTYLVCPRSGPGSSLYYFYYPYDADISFLNGSFNYQATGGEKFYFPNVFYIQNNDNNCLYYSNPTGNKYAKIIIYLDHIEWIKENGIKISSVPETISVDFWDDINNKIVKKDFEIDNLLQYINQAGEDVQISFVGDNTIVNPLISFYTKYNAH